MGATMHFHLGTGLVLVCKVDAEPQLEGHGFWHHHGIGHPGRVRNRRDDADFYQLVNFNDDELQLLLALLPQNLLHGAGIRAHRQFVLDHPPWYAW